MIAGGYPGSRKGKLVNFKSPPMPKTVKEKVNERSLHTKGEGQYKRNNPVGSHKEQTPNPEDSLVTQLKVRIIELSKFTKDKRTAHIPAFPTVSQTT